MTDTIATVQAETSNEMRLTRIQALVVGILNDLLRSRIDETDAAIDRAIAAIGAYCRRDRAYVFIFRDGLLYNTHEWCAPDIEPMIALLQGIPWAEYRELGAPLEHGEPLHVPDVAELPEGSAARTLFEMQSIRSVLLVPMMVGAGLYGLVGFDGVKHAHAFLPGEIYLLQSVADVICTVLLRRERERAVQEAQEALSRERAFLATILSTSPMGILVFDAEGKVRFSNDAASAILGLPREALLGAAHDDPAWKITQLDGSSPFKPGEWPYDRVLASGHAVEGVMVALHRPEGMRYVRVHAAPTAPEAGSEARVIYAFLDMTEQVRAEHALAEALEEARRANAAKTNFLARMSHEMRTPLNGVLGIAELLQRQVSDPEHQRMIKVLHDSGSLLLNIINDLLDLSKIEAEKLEIEKIPFSVSEIAERIETFYTLKASEKRLSFAVTILGDCARQRLGDPKRLLQIMHNLVSNAIKFTEEGGVTVRIDCSGEEAISLVVTDTGIGMRPEELSAAFEEFRQADASIARRYGGTGLGLPIVKRLVGLMGGTLSLKSAPGEGTEVSVRLPFAIIDPDELPSAEEATLVSEPVAALLRGQRDFASLRVLAADDNRTNRMILNSMLWQLGIRPVLVADGTSALSVFAPGQFDVVILDISMPDLDGVEVMQRMRAQARGDAECPLFLAFTANAMAHQVEAYRRAGFHDCLTKPLTLDRLARALAAARLRDQPLDSTSAFEGGALRTVGER